jgi:hypothetical protein
VQPAVISFRVDLVPQRRCVKKFGKALNPVSFHPMSCGVVPVNSAAIRWQVVQDRTLEVDSSVELVKISALRTVQMRR